MAMVPLSFPPQANKKLGGEATSILTQGAWGLTNGWVGKAARTGSELLWPKCGVGGVAGSSRQKG